MEPPAAIEDSITQFPFDTTHNFSKLRSIGIAHFFARSLTLTRLIFCHPLRFFPVSRLPHDIVAPRSIQDLPEKLLMSGCFLPGKLRMTISGWFGIARHELLGTCLSGLRFNFEPIFTQSIWAFISYFFLSRSVIFRFLSTRAKKKRKWNFTHS